MINNRFLNRLFMCGGAVAMMVGYSVTTSFEMWEIIGAPMFALGVLAFGAGFIDEIKDSNRGDSK